jgi:gamma-glutamylaminecyclotransferase
VIVFVYGTLKQGGCRHHHLGDAESLGAGRTRPEFRLYDCGEYPAMVRAASGVAILGELWRIDPSRLSILDDQEGVEVGLYERVTIPIRTESGEEVSAIAYLYGRSIDGLAELGDRW